MRQVFNVYCDESCHLENDNQLAMVLGAIWCPIEQVKGISARIREIKKLHGLKPSFEVKWVKVSPSKEDFYADLINYFFDNNYLHFRALIIPDKSKLKHESFSQDHDTWYYKMYFDMLKLILSPEEHYRIYIDIKDTRSTIKVAKLHKVLSNNMYDFHRKVLERVQTVRSHEIEIMQLTDLMVGAISYTNRHLTGSKAKLSLVERIRKKSRYRLTRTTLPWEKKLNLFRWHASEEQ